MRPYYLLEERLLRRNLSLIRDVAARSGAEIILAFKAYALWKTFPLFREYISATTASSLCEALLAKNEFGSLAHTYSPAYCDEEFPTIMACSSHITFNSFSQFERFLPQVRAFERHISCGIRVNPEYSEIETELYNPCAPGSRFGVLASQMPDILPSEIEGFHCHCHCESSAESLANTWHHLEARFGRWLPKLRWLNLGGGHLMTRQGYNLETLVNIIRNVRARYPNLRVILEPGSAFAWQTGALHAEVVDVVENHGIRTAILNTSFTCHMPDCLEMPYQPAVRGAQSLPSDYAGQNSEANVYRLGGNSCLSGDYMGCWRFPKALEVGDEVIFEDMLHYTTVKTNVFNGITHPDICFEHLDGTRELLRRFTYDDYRLRMD